MKLLSILSIGWLFTNYCAASDEELINRATSTQTCSIGIGRQFASTSWDITVYNVPQSQQQDFTIIGSLHNAPMDKGQNLTLTPYGMQQITITNVDNAVVFDYDNQVLNETIFAKADTGKTKVQLAFALAGGVKWTTANCTAGSVVTSAGRESWSCEFPCAISTANKEL